MRIAVFYNLNFGGAKRVVFEHVKGLKKNNHTVDVYTTDKFHDELDPGSVSDAEYRYTFREPKTVFPFIGRIRKDFATFISLKKLHKKIANDIDEKKYDIVLVHTDTITQSPFILLFLRTKNVYYCLEPLRIGYEYALRVDKNLNIPNRVYEYLTRYIRKEIDRKNARAAYKTTAISLFAREYMIHAYDIYPKVVYLGVDTTIFRKKAVKKKNQVFFLAEKVPIYGYDFALSAMELLPKKNRPELKILSWTRNANERLTDEEVATLYNESLVTLSLSKFDTFGLIPLESMACGTPVIAFNVAGYKETVKGNKTGFLVDFDASEIAEKIEYIRKHPDEARKMGENGRAWVEKNWKWEKHIVELENFLAETANS